jgi:hypothetical protein
LQNVKKCSLKKSCQKYSLIFCKLFYFLIFFSEKFEKQQNDDDDLSKNKNEIEESNLNYKYRKSKPCPIKTSLNVEKPKVTEKEQNEKNELVVKLKTTKLTIKSAMFFKKQKILLLEKNPLQNQKKT